MLPLKSDDGATLTDAAAVLKSSHQRVTRVSLLDSNFNPLPGLVFTGASGYAVDGQVQQDVSRSVRRTLDMTLANPDGVWTPTDELSAFYWDKMLKVERGVVVGGVEYFAPMGVFQIDSPEVTNKGDLSISGSDRVDRATSSEFTTPTNYAAGTRVGTVIQDILTDAGIGTSLWTINDGGATLGVDRNYEVGDERLQAALSLATAFALDVYADASGYMVIKPTPDPLALPTAFAFAEGVDSTYLGISKKWSRDRFYNHILVTGEGADTGVAIVRAEASVTDPLNPLRVTGPMGDRLYKYTSQMITTAGQAQSVANALLWEHAIIEEEIKLDHVPNPILEVDDAVSIVDAITATNDRYAIRSLSIPLAGGAASLTVKKIRVLS